ncbi:MAG: cytochrome C oxidase subunit III [Betaproteobacteria bacterium]|nr:MAG: cytochrome C oxidase subunit III [Betaproteobacteria bacterium]
MSTRREARPASVAAVRRGDALDVANLPSYGFGNRSLMWWGTAGMMAIEGAAFAFMIVIYFYLRSLSDSWPSGGAAPDLLWGTLNLGLILVSAVPNIYADRAAIDHDLGKVRICLVILSVIGLVLLLVRAMEFTTLNVRGDESAYGSVVWMLLGLHTFNLITDVADSLVLTALILKGPLEGKRFVDVAENSGYWNFVVVTWVPIYAVVYWGPRF